MSIALDRPRGSKMRTAAIAVFAAFTVLFLAYVDLFLALDDRAFKSVPRDFWHTFNFTYLTFLGVVVGILATAVCLAFIIARALPGSRTFAPIVTVTACASLIAWVLFFTFHGFWISVLAVLSTFAIVLAVVSAILGNRSANLPYRYALIPMVLTVLAMIGVVVSVILSYVSLNTVAPALFNSNLIELNIVVAVMTVATLVALVFVLRGWLGRR